MTTVSLHPVRRGISKFFIYAALFLLVAFIYFIVTNFAGYMWMLCFIGVLVFIIIANAISHPQLRGADADNRDS